MAEMMRRTGEVLDLWGDTEPTDADAVVLFLLSLNPRHRRHAQRRISERPGLRATPHEIFAFVDGYVQKQWQTLAIFYRMTIAGNPAEAAAWRAGPQECPDDWYDLSKVPDAVDAADGGDAA